MATEYTGDHPIAARSALWRPGAAWRSALRDVAIGALVLVGLLAFGALPIVLRFWLAMPELTRFSH
jgi:hypothetical protein